MPITRKRKASWARKKARARRLQLSLAENQVEPVPSLALIEGPEPRADGRERWLVLDDILTPRVDDYCDPPIVQLVRTKAEALQILESTPIDLLWLDYDLGRDGNVMALIDELVSRAGQGRPVPLLAVAVHSGFSPGAREIIDKLGAVGYMAVRRQLPT